MRVHVGPGFREQAAVHVALEAAHQQALFAQLLGVEKVDLPGFEPLAVERVLHHDEVGMPQPVGRLHQSEAGLFVQGRIVAEPDHHRTRVGVELVVIIAMKECLERRRRHHRLSRAGCGSQRERLLIPVLAPVLARLDQIDQHVANRFVLVVLEGELHASVPIGEAEIRQIRLV